MKLARPIAKTHLQLSQISKSFLREGHPLPALDRISLTVNPEELVALIRTLLCRKSLLLLDEPFGALDAFTRRQMHDWLLRVWQEFRFTALFVTHDVEEALLLADRIYVLSAQPAQVKTVIDVKLPRPRVPTESEFVRLKAELLAWLSQENSEPNIEKGETHVA